MSRYFLVLERSIGKAKIWKSKFRIMWYVELRCYTSIEVFYVKQAKVGQY